MVRTLEAPSGGLVSKVSASLVLNEAERLWLRAGWAQRAPRELARHPWARCVLSASYVDDTILTSLFCAACLAPVLLLIYPVTFDIEGEGTELDWLDITIRLNPFQIAHHRRAPLSP